MKLLRIGIIGAENTHSAAIANIINVQKKIRGFRVDCLWGETAELAAKVAEQGKIPHIVKRPADMLGKVDAVVIDHRHPKYHLKAAMEFVKSGMPVFVDKPFCYRVKDGLKFLAQAKKHKAPVMTFSVMPQQTAYIDFVKQMKHIGDVLSGATYGSGDITSPYGGAFFYGIHQVEMVLNAFGTDVKKVNVSRNSNVVAVQLIYGNGKIVTMNLVKEGCPGFSICAAGKARTISHNIGFDETPHLVGVQAFTKMFKTGKMTQTPEQILLPIRILEAIEKSSKFCKTVIVK